MRIPTIRGLIDRRILVNYRVDPEYLAAVVPEPFRPQLVEGWGMAGICLIRLKQIRPRWMPGIFGIGSENAAHRIAVEWESKGTTSTGVYIPRRDTSSLLNVLVGGRIFPGEHSKAHFDTQETDDHYRVEMRSSDGKTHVMVDGRVARDLPSDSLFDSVAEASQFFECGALGYSPNLRNHAFDGLELRSLNWRVQPLAVERVDSSFFNDAQLFPQGAAEFDNALLMRDIEHEWHSRDSLPMCAASC